MCLRLTATAVYLTAILCSLSNLAYASDLKSENVFDGDFYHARYGLSDTHQKLVDNRGNGFEALYGTRNIREVLKGILFRGGANNRYHRSHPRSNSNPLPNDGLVNLCEEGFKSAIYLYDTRFSTAPPVTNCQSIRGPNQLNYVKRTWNTQYRQALEMVYAAILDSSKAPIYLHCWNGWHASGMLSAFSLMQFCGMSPRDAVDYWVLNTDGTDDGNYQSIKTKIANFRPFAGLQIDSATRARICPN